MAPPLPVSRLASFAVLALAYFRIQNAAGDKAQNDADQAQILNCVKTVSTTLWKPGFIDITGDTGFPLLKGNGVPGAAGGRIGDGRVFGVGEACYFDPDFKSEKNSDREIFTDNVFEWLSHGKMNEIAIVPEWKCKFEALNERFKTVTVLNSQAEIATTSADVILIDGDTHTKYAADVIKRAKKGTGVLIVARNWVFRENYPNSASFEKNWGPNLVARAAGFTFRFDFYDKYVLKSWKSAIGYNCVK